VRGRPSSRIARPRWRPEAASRLWTIFRGCPN